MPDPGSIIPMEARLVETLPDGPGWQFEPKWDGFRCLAFGAGKSAELRAKSGRSLSRFFPEVATMLGRLGGGFVLDGELLIPQGDSLAFDALQMRLHPAASRIARLAKETPALFMAFDLLADAGGRSLLDKTLIERRAALEEFIAVRGERAEGLRLSPFTRQRAQAGRWLKRAGGGALDGVVAKRLDEPYQPGERAMLKIKCLRSADCVVGGFRYAQDSKQVGSLLLGLYNDAGRLDHVGFTSAIANADRAALTRKLERLKGEPGFDGEAPGGPSRWSTERSAQWVPLKPRLVVEVQYDQITAGRFRHGTRLLRFRPDKAPRQCTFDQLQSEARPSTVLRRALRRDVAR